MGRSIPVRMRLALALAVIAACLAVYTVGALAGDLTFPPLSGRVVDAAGLLTHDQRQALEAKLKAHADRTSDQVIVAIVPSLQGTTIRVLWTTMSPAAAPRAAAEHRTTGSPRGCAQTALGFWG